MFVDNLMSGLSVPKATLGCDWNHEIDAVHTFNMKYLY